MNVEEREVGCEGIEREREERRLTESQRESVLYLLVQASMPRDLVLGRTEAKSSPGSLLWGAAAHVLSPSSSWKTRQEAGWAARQPLILVPGCGCWDPTQRLI